MPWPTVDPMPVLATLAFLISQSPDLSGFATLPADKAPPALTRDSHYWVGNEHRLDLFVDDLKGKGGVHVGVGAEQNWLLCGWSRCEVIVLMDFDESITDLHRVYVAAFAAAATKEAFVALWLDKKRAGLREAIKARYEGTERTRALAALDVARWSVERRFSALRSQLVGRGHTTFFTDDGDYAHVRGLVLGGRAFMVRGDLTARGTLQAIAAATTKAGLTIRSLYLSNAEQYFRYDTTFRENIAALPFDARSVVLRTHGWNTLRYAKDGNSYHYGIQTGASFRAFAAEPAVTSSRESMLWGTEHHERGCTRQTSEAPLEAKAAFAATRTTQTTTTKGTLSTARTKQAPPASPQTPTGSTDHAAP
jgi:hypothetical protein